MSGFFFLWRRDGAPVDPEDFESVFATLAHRGADGCNSRLDGPVGAGHQHFWISPEEVGERLPLCGPDGGAWVLWDGFLQDRESLLEHLGGDPGRSDAALALSAYERWGDSFFERLDGSYVFCLWDPSRRTLLAGRDECGLRTLFYSATPSSLAVASEAETLRHLPNGPRRADPLALAAILGGSPPPPGRTPIEGLRELPRGTLLRADQTSESLRIVRSIEAREPIRSGSDREMARFFLEEIDASVRACLRSRGPVAVTMSGGLDSTTVAALAARASTEDVRTVSWVFDRLTSCDERLWIDAMSGLPGLRGRRFAGDDFWPLSEEWSAGFAATPIRPFFRELMDRSHREAADAGCRVVLNGWAGDELFDGMQDWFASLLFSGRLWTAGGEILRAARSHDRTSRLARSLRPVARTFVPARLRRWRRRDGESPPPWLTPDAGELWRRAERESPRAALPRGLPLDFSAWFLPHHAAASARCGVETRSPLWSRRVIEAALRLPAHMLYRPDRYKYALRLATENLLPDSVRARTERRPLNALFRKGFFDMRLHLVRETLFGAGATWPVWLDREWVSRALERGAVDASLGGRETVALWNGFQFERWARASDVEIDVRS